MGGLSLLRGGEISPTQSILVTQATLYLFPLLQTFLVSTLPGPGWVRTQTDEPWTLLGPAESQPKTRRAQLGAE